MYCLVLTGHTDHVTALAWEPGSDTLLASASKVNLFPKPSLSHILPVTQAA